MTISSSTISSIQKTGAAAYAASEKLKKEADNYAKRVREALNDNPFDLNNDALIENWKIVAKLVQTLTGMENELKNIHHIASNLATEEPGTQPTHKVLSLLAPTATTATTATTASKNQDAVDVTPKKTKRVKDAVKASVKAVVKAAPKASGKRATKPAAKAATKPEAKAAKAATAPAKALKTVTKAATATKAVKPTKPVKATKPVKPAKAAKAAAAPVTATVVPVKATKPVKAKKPAKPTAPVETTAPEATNTASNIALDATGVTTVPVNQTVTTKNVTNADKLLGYLAATLNAENFIAINLKTATEATGIPMGSINAAFKKVIELGKVHTDGIGGYRLAA